MPAKTICPINRQDFHTQAQPVPIKIGDKEYQADVKEFSTGSLGWYFNGKTVIEIGGKKVTVQVGMNMTIIGSKDLPKETTQPVAAAQASVPEKSAESL